MFAAAPEAVAAPYIAALHAPSSLVGWWLTALPIGLIAGDVLGVRFLSSRQQRRLVFPVAAASCMPYLAFAVDPGVRVAIPLLVVAGALGLFSLGLDARIRDAAPLPLFTRTMTVASAGLMALQGIGFTLAGAIAQAVGPGRAITICGGCGLATVLLLSGPGLRSLGVRRPGRSGRQEEITYATREAVCPELASRPEE
jgi:hypothetical protein